MKKLLISLQAGVTVLMSLFLLVPIAMSIVAGVTDNYFRGWRGGLTLRWVAQVWELYRDAIFLSLGIALATLAIVLAIGVPAGYALTRSPRRLARLLESLLVLPVAVPGLASALALLVVYGGFTAFRNSWLFIVAGHVVFTLPFMVRAVAAICLSQNLKTLEEGAASLGATFRQRFLTVVLPNIRPGVIAGALTVVTLSIGEFNLTWMLHTPATKTLPVGLADAYASMRLEVGSAYTLIFFIMIVPLLVLMQRCGADARKSA
ncbi:ABC transporter permease [Chromobacterium sphagni]|uniref:ABC transporter permease n=1 Tax=Chromobacterium sphagni TaxID=1903179 RepID=A0A1S1X1U8_9NEIS|nr:ABC transporter permease [Chromobacterium sphagni]OHX13370.1 ABC transporter permease [Chromobacterium sphagni]OHX19627.1 ABC transporter permease [Chromobacterium sphagni]